MSNARYFADGIDYWRVLYPDGSTEGPYISPVSARKVGKNMIRLRQEYRGWAASRVLHREYRVYESFQLQKLMPVQKPCPLDPQYICTPEVCFGHGYTLEWENWNE